MYLQLNKVPCRPILLSETHKTNRNSARPLQPKASGSHRPKKLGLLEIKMRHYGSRTSCPRLITTIRPATATVIPSSRKEKETIVSSQADEPCHIKQGAPWVSSTERDTQDEWRTHDAGYPRYKPKTGSSRRSPRLRNSEYHSLHANYIYRYPQMPLHQRSSPPQEGKGDRISSNNHI